MTLSPDMIARIAERRANDWCYATPVEGLSDEKVAALIEREDAAAAAEKAADLAAESAKLAALGLSRGQIVRAMGCGSHYDSHGAEVVSLEGAEWCVSGIDGSGRIVLSPAGRGDHYALARREQIAA